MKKWAGRIFYTTLTTVVVVVSAAYLFTFVINLPKLRAISAQGVEFAGTKSDDFHALARAGLGDRHIRKEGMYLVMIALRHNNIDPQTPESRAAAKLWQLASRLHFNKSQTYGFWVRCSMGGCQKGLNLASKRMFGKSLKYLTQMQMAMLVAMVENPQKYRPGSRANLKRAREIIRTMKEQANIDYLSPLN